MRHPRASCAARGPGTGPRPDLRVEGLELVDLGRMRRPPKRATASAASAAMPGNARLAGQEPLDGDVVGGDERGGGARARRARRRVRARAPGSASSSGASKVMLGVLQEVEARRRAGRAPRVGEWRTGWGCACPGGPAGP